MQKSGPFCYEAISEGSSRGSFTNVYDEWNDSIFVYNQRDIRTAVNVRKELDSQI